MAPSQRGVRSLAAPFFKPRVHLRLVPAVPREPLPVSADHGAPQRLTHMGRRPRAPRGHDGQIDHPQTHPVGRINPHTSRADLKPGVPTVRSFGRQPLCSRQDRPHRCRNGGRSWPRVPRVARAASIAPQFEAALWEIDSVLVAALFIRRMTPAWPRCRSARVDYGAGGRSICSRSAFKTTDTELRLIASAANIGESSTPKAGYRTPAATGTPSAL